MSVDRRVNCITASATAWYERANPLLVFKVVDEREQEGKLDLL